MLKSANSYVGDSRSSNPEVIEQFLKLFGLGLRYPNGKYVPFCAAGVSFVTCLAYCQIDPTYQFLSADPNKTFRQYLSTINEYYFLPSPACRSIVTDAKHRTSWISNSQLARRIPLPGWLVFFDWYGDGQPHHVGLVESATRVSVTTIEFNTSAENNENGGAVARRNRPYTNVLGFIGLN
jgi:hypothetical protein